MRFKKKKKNHQGLSDEANRKIQFIYKIFTYICFPHEYS